MNDFVLSVEQVKELKSLGLDMSNASMCWGRWLDAKKYSLFTESVESREEYIKRLIEDECFDKEDAKRYRHVTIPTFTLQDIMCMLPNLSKSNEYTNYPHLFRCDSGWCCSYGSLTCEIKGTTPLEAAFGMLKWCIANNYL